MSNINTISIGNTSLVPIEYEGKRVVTFKMVDQAHERSNGTDWAMIIFS